MAAAKRSRDISRLGSTVMDGGVNFSVYSRNATAIDLLLFDREGDPEPSRVIAIDRRQRTYHYWHTFVEGVEAGQIYAFRAHGPFDPSAGFRFDPEKVLLDPYGGAVAIPAGYSREAAAEPGDNAAQSMKSIVVDSRAYDWGNDIHPRHPSSQSIIYEMHVRGFTRHSTSGIAESRRGTYAGLIDKIPYLQALGITAVELLPVFQYDMYDAPPGRINYWGYAPIAFFAPHRSYSSRQDLLGPVDEFRDMVKALHAANIEVLLDVVFNHTAEGDHTGPTLCFRGLENAAYYILTPDLSRYANYSGTGNTFNANHPIVRRLILDCLRYWVGEMHVDGFRFDLASILARDSTGMVMPNPPLLWDIESDPVLAGTKLIAEAWDAAGLYQVGSFVGDSWKEWNGRFRDDLRDFFRGAENSVSRFADRLIGSPEVFAHEEREAEQSINFVTCHDGFTLNDLVSYNGKHNEANGEDNRDGSNDNRSWNCGIEGPSEDPSIEDLRNRQAKNFLATTLLSVGMPMILMGDEVRRSQQGNNNAYCQDNEISWFDWTLLDKHSEIHRFLTLLNQRRRLRSSDHEQQGLTLSQVLATARRSWHGVQLNQPDWSSSSHCLALNARLRTGRMFHLILNAYWEALEFQLPSTEGAGPWRRWIDTALPSPNDIVPWHEAPSISAATYRAGARSVVMLFAEDI